MHCFGKGRKEKRCVKGVASAEQFDKETCTMKYEKRDGTGHVLFFG